MELLKQYQLGDMLVRYYLTPTRNVEWIIVPINVQNKVQLPDKIKYDSLIQVKLVGDDYPKGFVTGMSMRNSQTTRRLQFVDQTATVSETITTITTKLTDQQGHFYTHVIEFDANYKTLITHVQFENRSAEVAKVELLASFSMSNLSPFNRENLPGNLLLTRFRSKWAQEGRIAQNPIEDFQLEPSWKPSGAGLEKYGQLGSMPVRGYFPNVFVTDRQQDVTWGVQLVQPNSWQIEAYRIDEDLCLQGGLADRDFGHWLKSVLPNEIFQTPYAYLTVCQGDYHVASHRLVDFQHKALVARHHTDEQKFPISFNEFCTTWGSPSEHTVLEQVEILKNKGIKYYVIDAGWYADAKLGWERKMGDWKLSPALFPNGLKKVVDQVHAAGMIPGIWFEIETVGRDAVVFNAKDHLLQRDGIPITIGDRRFWNMNDPWTIQYLQREVIDFLSNNKIGYLKIDYNENFGIGCDHPDSLGEGNRQALQGSQNFIRRIHEQLPNLIIENCSSGGHRMEPSSMALADLDSISDDHESLCNPIVSANMLDFSLPQENLIWSVIRESDPLDHIYYSLCSSFLGRLCLSGDITSLSKEQWQAIDDGINFYHKIVPFLQADEFKRYGEPVLSYRQPAGNQAVMFKLENEFLVVAHNFSSSQPITIELSSQNNTGLKLITAFGRTEGIKLGSTSTTIDFTGDYQAAAMIVKVN